MSPPIGYSEDQVVKINPLAGAFGFLNSVQKRGDGGTGENPQQQHQPRRNPENTENSEFSEESALKAVEDFRTDPHAQASGLTATTQGSGPGLKVVLKDVNGGVVRQFSGEEFLRLREAVGKAQGKRGGLLDRKF